MKYEVDVDVEQTLRDRSLTTSQEQSLVVKTGNEEPRKRHHRIASSSDVSDDSDNNDTPSHKRSRAKSQSCVQSSAAPAYRYDDKESKESKPDGK